MWLAEVVWGVGALAGIILPMFLDIHNRRISPWIWCGGDILCLAATVYLYLFWLARCPSGLKGWRLALLCLPVVSVVWIFFESRRIGVHLMRGVHPVRRVVTMGTLMLAALLFGVFTVLLAVVAVLPFFTRMYNYDMAALAGGWAIFFWSLCFAVTMLSLGLSAGKLHPVPASPSRRRRQFAVVTGLVWCLVLLVWFGLYRRARGHYEELLDCCRQAGITPASLPVPAEHLADFAGLEMPPPEICRAFWPPWEEVRTWIGQGEKLRPALDAADRRFEALAAGQGRAVPPPELVAGRAILARTSLFAGDWREINRQLLRLRFYHQVAPESDALKEIIQFFRQAALENRLWRMWPDELSDWSDWLAEAEMLIDRGTLSRIDSLIGEFIALEDLEPSVPVAQADSREWLYAGIWPWNWEIRAENLKQLLWYRQRVAGNPSGRTPPAGVNRPAILSRGDEFCRKAEEICRESDHLLADARLLRVVFALVSDDYIHRPFPQDHDELLEQFFTEVPRSPWNGSKPEITNGVRKFPVDIAVRRRRAAQPSPQLFRGTEEAEMISVRFAEPSRESESEEFLLAVDREMLRLEPYGQRFFFRAYGWSGPRAVVTEL